MEPSPPDAKPAGNQFSLRGMFVLLTAVSAIMALLTLAIRQPLHWLGTLAVIAFCLAVIGILELIRKLFPPKPRFIYYLPPPTPRPLIHPLQTLDYSDNYSPFAPPAPGESPFAAPPSEAPSESPPPSPPPAGQ
jgi:hypothetical protein